MENIEEKIYALLRKSPQMRNVYQKYPKIKDDELLIELEAQSKIEDMVSTKPILKEALFGFEKLFNLKPSEILEKIEYKNDTDIRLEFEQMKREGGINSGEKNFGTDKGGYFKSGIGGGEAGSDFSGGPNSLNF